MIHQSTEKKLEREECPSRQVPFFSRVTKVNARMILEIKFTDLRAFTPGNAVNLIILFPTTNRIAHNLLIAGEITTSPVYDHDDFF